MHLKRFTIFSIVLFLATSVGFAQWWKKPAAVFKNKKTTENVVPEIPEPEIEPEIVPETPESPPPFVDLNAEATVRIDSIINIMAETNIVDPHNAVPDGFESNLDYLMHSWIVQKNPFSDCDSTRSNVPVPDIVYKERLAQLECIMEMPYNTIIRSNIEAYTVKRRKQLSYMMGLSDYYFPIFEQTLVMYDLPLELKYLPIIESALNATITSRMGAAGLWQFMVATGRMYGLEVNSLVDERLDPIKSSHAAAQFLKDLYNMFEGDWHLAIAAYNCGPGNVRKAITRSGGKRDYWTIYPYLPRETRGYVPIFIAAVYAFNYAAEHNICKTNVGMPLLTDTVVIKDRIHLKQIADVLEMPIEQVRLLNPQYKKDIVPGNKNYSVCLPINQANAFIECYDEIIAYQADSLINNRRKEIEIAQRTPVGGSGNVFYHTVTKGQTLSHIAARYGVSVSKIKQWNNLKNNNLRIGQRLRIVK